MESFSVGDHVVLKQGLPQHDDHVGTVVRVEDAAVWVQWGGPEAPSEPTKFSRRALEAAEGGSKPSS